MFIGHIAAALAGKRAAPRTSLGVLLGAATFLDLIWPILLLAGVERVRIDPGNTAFTPLDFEWYPVSHSLLAALGWSVLAGGAYLAVTRYRFGALTIAALVLSHWVLDWVTHRPDLPLVPGGARVGLGLWSSVPGTIVTEMVMLVLGLGIYLGTSHPRDGVGRWGFRGLMAFVVLIYLGNIFGPPPPDARTVAWFALAAWLLPLWAGWADAHRRVTPQVPETAFGAVAPAG